MLSNLVNTQSMHKYMPLFHHGRCAPHERCAPHGENANVLIRLIYIFSAFIAKIRGWLPLSCFCLILVLAFMLNAVSLKPARADITNILCASVTDSDSTAEGASRSISNFFTDSACGGANSGVSKTDFATTYITGAASFAIAIYTNGDRDISVGFGTDITEVELDGVSKSNIFTIPATTTDAIASTIHFTYGGQDYAFDVAKDGDSDTIKPFPFRNISNTVPDSPTITAIIPEIDERLTIKGRSKAGYEVTVVFPGGAQKTAPVSSTGEYLSLIHI